MTIDNLLYLDQSIPPADHEHCWHPDRDGWLGNVQPLICCHCGFRAEQPHRNEKRIADGHGPHFFEWVNVPDGPVRRRFSDSLSRTRT
jgi:hypothetical protein